MPRLTLLLALLAVPGLARAQSVCLLEVADSAAEASVAEVIKTLEKALPAHFTMVPHKRAVASARALRLPRTQWLSGETVGRITKRAGCQYALAARFTAALGARRLYLSAFDAQGEERAEVWVPLTRARLSAEQAQLVVASLASALSPQAVAPPPAPAPAPTPDAPPAAAPGPDPWADAVTGFDTPSPQGPTTGQPGVVEGLRLDTAVEVGARVAFEHYAFFETPDPTRLGGRDDLEASLRVKAVHPRATAFASLLARLDFVDPSRNRFDPEEAWVDLNLPSVSIKAGRLLTSWGSASLYNPSDVLNAVDYRDPLDPEKLGALMVQVAATLGPLTLELSYLPVPESHRLQVISGISADGVVQSNSRWLDSSLDVPSNVPLTFHVAPFAAPPPRPSNSQAAARLELSVGGADLGLGYASLLDHLPSPLLEVVPQAGLPVAADLYVDWAHRRLHVIAFDAERTFGRVRVAAETAAFLTADLSATNPRVADPYLIANGGFDVQTPQFLGDQQLHFFLEFSLARALVGKRATDGLDVLRYPFPLNLLGRLSWDAGPDLHLEVNVFSSLERFDLMIAPRVEYSFFDRVKARVGVDFLAGEKAGFFGRFANNSRFIATVEARF